MWDQSRLQRLKLFDTPFVPSPIPQSISYDDRIDAVIDSLMARRKLFLKGARGRWTKEDESNLEWKHPMELSDDEVDIEKLMQIVSL
ncbi:uncharacterized protein LDX57_006983 [Aspergillus melleus]|uniref:uncharacterized protein n=1 Tax=Aspergillus melleus TaxID=138277 RepID=UPI001E8EE7C3|nr:uncharacterized protein LDX57_006983 [Aspergillus melleus]KAH8429316.1 hypothetical protein LDX57_006983 [Aspergillus melleus]